MAGVDVPFDGAERGPVRSGGFRDGVVAGDGGLAEVGPRLNVEGEFVDVDMDWQAGSDHGDPSLSWVLPEFTGCQGVNLQFILGR